MNRYWPLFSKFRRFHYRYNDPQISWRNGITFCKGRNRGPMSSTLDIVCVENSFCSREYSSLGVNTIPVSNDEFHSDGFYEARQNSNDFHTRGESNPRVGSVNIGKNAEQNQQQSSSTSYYATNHCSNYGHHTTQEVRVNLQHTGYSNRGESAALQRVSNHQTPSTGHCHQNSSNLYVGNGVAYPPGGCYPQEHVDARSTRNVNPNVPFQQQMNSSFRGQSAVDDDEFDADNDVEGTLEELDDFCKQWDLEHAVKSMRKLSKRGVSIDMPHYLILIDACGKAKALKEAQDVHQHLIRFNSPVTISVFNKMLEMYGRCGSMDDAYSTFNSMPERNLTSWDTMITWFTKNGLGEDSIDMFTKFKEAGLKPDGEMFLGIFDACGVLGDVTEGLLHFDSMTKIYGIVPTMAHYASIVHMFGSAGDLDGALEFIEKMPVEPSVSVWESLMIIARIQGNVEIGDRCAEIVEQLDPTRLSKELKEGLLPIDSDAPKKKVKKYNPLEHTKHEYRAGDRSHPENNKIYAVLRGMKESVKEAGYIPETKFVLHDIDPEGKEEAIMAHSERLACTYALITSAARMPFRIIKNLRVCGDCHNYFKIISSMVGREIIMRDAKRFHHFRDGKCSCNDYW